MSDNMNTGKEKRPPVIVLDSDEGEDKAITFTLADDYLAVEIYQGEIMMETITRGDARKLAVWLVKNI